MRIIKELLCEHCYEEYARQTNGGFLEKGKVWGGTKLLIAKCVNCGKVIEIKLKPEKNE